MAAGVEQRLRRFEGGVAQFHRKDVVAQLDPRGEGGGIAEDDIRRAAQGLGDAPPHLRRGHIALEDGYTGDRRDGLQIDGDHLAPLADDARDDLRPGAGRGTEIDDGVAAAEDAEAFVDLQQLVGGAGAVTGLLGLPEVAIVLLVRAPVAPIAASAHRPSA